MEASCFNDVYSYYFKSSQVDAKRIIFQLTMPPKSNAIIPNTKTTPY